MVGLHQNTYYELTMSTLYCINNTMKSCTEAKSYVAIETDIRISERTLQSIERRLSGSLSEFSEQTISQLFEMQKYELEYLTLQKLKYPEFFL